MICRHLFQIVPIQKIAGLTECKNLVDMMPLLLWKKLNKLLKFVFFENGLLLVDFSFSKKDMVLSKYNGMSARTSNSPDFWRAKFKGCTPANMPHNIKMVARNFGHVIATNMPQASGSFLKLPHVARADTICLQRFLQAWSCVIHLVTVNKLVSPAFHHTSLLHSS